MKEERKPRSGEIYKHFKGKLYQVVTVATHSETSEQFVIYQALYGSFKSYARPYSNFISEVDHIKYPDIKQKYRFELQQEVENILNDSIEEKNCFTSAEKGDEMYTLYDFLDASTYKEKIDIFRMMQKDIDEKTLSDIAVSMDIVIDSKSIDEKCIDILNCLNTMARFECDRLR